MNGFLKFEDGEIIKGELFGFRGETEGEVVFSTGMTGYVQSLTDPSFSGQILTFTYPLIGNYGVPEKIYLDSHLLSNFESEKIWVRAVVVSSFSEIPSHHESFTALDTWLKKEKIPGIWGVDTRALTQKIREKGVVWGKISSNPRKEQFSSESQSTLVSKASLPSVVMYPSRIKNVRSIALIDCGVKHGIIRELLRLGYCVTRVPWNINPLSLKQKFDGVICSNGPGDPKDCAITVKHIREIIDRNIPFLGVCLGHQLLALAIGADTYKLKYGHRGLNQPCQELYTKKAYVTSQNHGFAVDRKSIPKDYEEWFINLNDGTVEGIRHKKKNIRSVQFHPEGCPGPYDTRWIYKFI